MKYAAPSDQSGWPPQQGTHRAATESRRKVLIVEDDPITAATLAQILRREGIDVDIADSGRHAIARGKSGDFDFIVLDLQLPDIDGAEVIRALREHGVEAEFVVVSGFATVENTVEVMKLGALDVLEKPFDSDELVALFRGSPSAERSRSPESPRHVPLSRTKTGPHWLDAIGSAVSRLTATGGPHSAVDRWVLYVLKACELPYDPKTLSMWARAIGVSNTSLRETCYLSHVRPHDARDFARALRATIILSTEAKTLESILDISDRRTLSVFSERTGLRPADPSIDEFLKTQPLLPCDGDALRLIRSLWRALH